LYVGNLSFHSTTDAVRDAFASIGEVSDVQLNDADLFPRIQVRPSAALVGLEEVVVLVGAPVDSGEAGGGE
jgi:cell shape-determining protein MreC